MLLELKGIKKYFPVKKGFFPKVSGYVRAVDRVDLSIKAGENLSLVGESGSGKTTLGRALMKLIPVNDGRIIFDGQDITELSHKDLRAVRRNIQMVFQDPYSSLDPRYTIRRIMLEAMIFGDEKTPAQKDEKMREMLKAVQLPEDILERYPHEFSGGERQRIAIARALVMNPKLLILDEAVSALDVLVQQQIIDLLKGLQDKFKLTYFFISHNLRIVKKISERIAVMYKGRIVEYAPTAEIFKNPIHPYTQELLSAALNYKASKRQDDIFIPENAVLTDRGNGHFVIGE